MGRVKIAALVQAHHRPANLEKLLSRISGDLWRPLVHLDAKSRVTDFAVLADPALRTRRRVSVSWGGLRSVFSAIVLIEEALERTDCTHFYLMSGQCYPVKSDFEIASAISIAPVGSANWISCRPMPTPDKPSERYTKLWAYDIAPLALRRAAKRLFRLLPPATNDRLMGIKPFGGSAWWLLERAAAEKMLQFYQNNASLLRALKFSQIPDEWLPQSIFVHLGLKSCGPGPTAALWIGDKANPELITEQNYMEVASGHHFLARKFLEFYPDGGIPS